MKNKYLKKFKSPKNLPLSLYFLEKDLSVMDRTLLKLGKVDSINSRGSRIVSFYKPISKL